MSYTALYRKYRPDAFQEVKGQDHVVTTLRNQITADRVGHAYLFCGTRGTGKTSVAKIFAKAVNCEHPVDGSPCGECPTCKAIAAGSAMNVIEIDAASNNGVENIRQIREEVAYSPTQGKYKVYIIDEVHMLSAGAFNALLKTLEEPPSYVIFILATTEAHKIPVTILSRCQRYDFHRITQGEITERLTALLAREGVEAEEKALRYIARKADGGMRDALSLTDQCISFYIGQKLTYDKVLRVLGAVDTEQLDALFHAIWDGNVAGVFALVDKMIGDGKDLSQLTSDLTEHIRNILLLKAAGEGEDIIDASQENLALLRQDAERIPGSALMRYIRILSDLSNQLRYAVNKRVLLEVALIRLCKPQMEHDEVSLLERVRKLEEALEKGDFVVRAQARPSGQAVYAAPSVQEAAPPKVYAKAVPEDLQQITNAWRSIAAGIDDNLLKHSLETAKLQFDPTGAHEGEIYVVLDNVMDTAYAGNKAAQELIEQAIADKLGKTVAVHLCGAQEAASGMQLQQIEVKHAAMEHIHAEIETDDFDDDDF